MLSVCPLHRLQTHNERKIETHRQCGHFCRSRSGAIGFILSWSCRKTSALFPHTSSRQWGDISNEKGIPPQLRFKSAPLYPPATKHKCMRIARGSRPAFPRSFSNLGCHGIVYWVELETEMSQLIELPYHRHKPGPNGD